MRKRVVLGLIAVAAVAGCSKKSDEEVRWLESGEKKETIIFYGRIPNPAGSGAPGSVNTAANSFFFQARKLPPESSYPNASGLYFFQLEKDSILFRNNDRKFYFVMSPDQKSFTIGRFFPENGTRLPDKLVFIRQ
ncbi:hypothetical protein [Chitinophaga deserti]|uniref:hypothetical protein n=1 Tax=Chitinophaga deserti TaxID=2164099 RepID=UPI000D6C57A2|nr:hypothetical protein [Chitinophaga deserti]